MPLTLTITSFQRLSPGQEVTRTLERGSISIGRAPSNDWVLQDPERILSSKHCTVHHQDGRYFLTDTSTNGTFLNDSSERITREQTVALHDGDRFILGEYEIAVSITTAASAVPVAPQATEEEGPVTDVMPRPASGAMPDIAIPEITPPVVPAVDIARPSFSDLLTDNPEETEEIEESGESSGQEDSLGLRPRDKAPLGAAITEPSADLLSPDRAAFEPPVLVSQIGPVPTPKPEPKPVTRPEPVPTPVPVPIPLPEPEPAPVADALIPDDWWNVAPPVSRPTPAPAPLEPPPVSRPTPAPAPLEPPPAARPVLDAALLYAFCDGAGLPHLHTTAEQLPELMIRLGAIFRETVQGLMEILLARGDVKGEFRLDRTAIGPIENNPLKTPPGQPPLRAEEVMTLLLLGQQSAYMAPVQAVREGFTDIKAHQLAVMAGIQAALARLLERFDPENLETRLEHGLLDSILPLNRKAKYWDLFKAEYASIAREAEDDFNKLFGDAFARAYEEHQRSR
ncbi:MAG TPA: type VI secretion system-associated FHA domain protein TagH [Candidatus Competibacteraceae bacterium]|nr:type VI secretion system-associated FHA domain protein TagH [Candidatus Competibacteraceae bacterium]HQC71589.1 type VI secretion system-associated FHA domain protein TagH [Candidatus Competibacteraceae bacterium]